MLLGSFLSGAGGDGVVGGTSSPFDFTAACDFGADEEFLEDFFDRAMTSARKRIDRAAVMLNIGFLCSRINEMPDPDLLAVAFYAKIV